MADNSNHIYTISSGNSANAKPFFSTNVKKQDGKIVRYFSGVNADIYFNNIYIDETNLLQFTVNQSTMLIFGYNSYVFDSIAKGSRSIQGNFNVNFTSSNYIYSVLNTLQALDNKSKLCSMPNQPLWNRGFDIYLSLGNNTNNPTKDASEQVVRLMDVHLVGSQTICNAKTGEPIEETYSFVAKDIDFYSNGISYKDSVIAAEKKTEEEKDNYGLELKSVSTNVGLTQITFELSDTITVYDAQWKFSYDSNYHNITLDTTDKTSTLLADVSSDQYAVYKKIPDYVPVYVHLLLEYETPFGSTEEIEFKHQIK